MQTLNEAAAYLGVDAITLGVWLGTGFMLGLIMVGKRPLGLLGDLFFGMVGGLGGGWGFVQADIDLAQYASQIAPTLSEQSAGYVGAAAEAFIGALLLLVLLRLVIRR